MVGTSIRLRTMQLYGDDTRERALHKTDRAKIWPDQYYRKSDYCTSGRGLVSSRGPELGAVEADVGREKA